MFVTKKLILLLFFFISSLCFSQENIEFVKSKDSYILYNSIVNTVLSNIKKRDSILVNSIEYKIKRSKEAMQQHKWNKRTIYFSTKAFPKSLYKILNDSHTIATRQFKTRFKEYNLIFSQKEIENYIKQLNVVKRDEFDNKEEYYKQFNYYYVWNKEGIKNKNIKFLEDEIKTNPSTYKTGYYISKPIYSIHKTYALLGLQKGEVTTLLVYKKEKCKWKAIGYF